MTSTMNFGDGKLRAGAGGGSAVGHSVGDRTGLEPRQEAPLPAPQAIIEADLALNVNG